jgi:hypothetical protein
MFRRLFLLVVGAGFGFGVAFWLMRLVREKVDRYAPERLRADLAEAVRSFAEEVRSAFGEGLEAMREREAELRADIEAGPAPLRQRGAPAP